MPVAMSMMSWAFALERFGELVVHEEACQRLCRLFPLCRREALVTSDSSARPCTLTKNSPGSYVAPGGSGRIVGHSEVGPHLNRLLMP
jgi:hypothetical protein